MTKKCDSCNTEISSKDSFYFEKKKLCIKCLNNNLLKAVFNNNDIEVKTSERMKHLILDSINASPKVARKNARSRLYEYGIQIITGNDWAQKRALSISLILNIIFLLFRGYTFLSTTTLNIEIVLTILKSFFMELIGFYLLMWLLFKVISVIGDFPRFKIVVSVKKRVIKPDEGKIQEYKTKYSKMSEDELEKLLENPEDLMAGLIEIIENELNSRKGN